MGKTYVVAVDKNNIYACAKCKTQLASYDQLISKTFTGTTGRAFLFKRVCSNQVQHQLWPAYRKRSAVWSPHYSEHFLCQMQGTARVALRILKSFTLITESRNIRSTGLFWKSRNSKNCIGMKSNCLKL